MSTADPRPASTVPPTYREKIEDELKHLDEHVLWLETGFGEVLKCLENTGGLYDQNNQVMLLSREWEAIHNVSYSKSRLYPTLLLFALLMLILDLTGM